jgi:hypothetical protein
VSLFLCGSSNNIKESFIGELVAAQSLCSTASAVKFATQRVQAYGLSILHRSKNNQCASKVIPQTEGVSKY